MPPSSKPPRRSPAEVSTDKVMTLSGGMRSMTLEEALRAIKKHDPIGQTSSVGGPRGDGEIVTHLWTEVLLLRAFARSFVRAQGTAVGTPAGALLDQIEKPHDLLGMARRGGWPL